MNSEVPEVWASSLLLSFSSFVFSCMRCVSSTDLIIQIKNVDRDNQNSPGFEGVLRILPECYGCMLKGRFVCVGNFAWDKKLPATNMTSFSDVYTAGRNVPSRVLYLVYLILLSYVLLAFSVHHSGNSQFARSVFNVAVEEPKRFDICRTLLAHSATLPARAHWPWQPRSVEPDEVDRSSSLLQS